MTIIKRAAFFREDAEAEFNADADRCPDVVVAGVDLWSVSCCLAGWWRRSRISSPVRSAVAQGDFDTRLPAPTRDEIGFLISSFNDMTQRLSSARREASLSQALVEAERANLAVILDRLSTGVVALESDLTNSQRERSIGLSILNVNLEESCGRVPPGRRQGSAAS